MKTMLITDLVVARNILLQLLGICIVVGLVMSFAMETTVGGVAAVAAMAPFMYLFSMAGIDELNGWERFRLTLPMSRRQVMFGRYASMLVVTVSAVAIAFLIGVIAAAAASGLSDGQPDARLTLMSLDFNPPAAILVSVVSAALVILLASTIALPLIARFGVTKATRFVPLAFVIIVALGVGFFGENIANFTFLANLESAIDAGNWGVLLGGFGIASVVVIALYVGSAFVAAKLYEQRQF